MLIHLRKARDQTALPPDSRTDVRVRLYTYKDIIESQGNPSNWGTLIRTPVGHKLVSIATQNLVCTHVEQRRDIYQELAFKNDIS